LAGNAGAHAPPVPSVELPALDGLIRAEQAIELPLGDTEAFA
jgi:hypothetical protein